MARCIRSRPHWLANHIHFAMPVCHVFPRFRVTLTVFAHTNSGVSELRLWLYDANHRRCGSGRSWLLDEHSTWPSAKTSPNVTKDSNRTIADIGCYQSIVSASSFYGKIKDSSSEDSHAYIHEPLLPVACQPANGSCNVEWFQEQAILQSMKNSSASRRS